MKSTEMVGILVCSFRNRRHQKAWSGLGSVSGPDPAQQKAPEGWFSEPLPFWAAFGPGVFSIRHELQTLKTKSTIWDSPRDRNRIVTQRKELCLLMTHFKKRLIHKSKKHLAFQRGIPGALEKDTAFLLAEAFHHLPLPSRSSSHTVPVDGLYHYHR